MGKSQKLIAALFPFVLYGCASDPCLTEMLAYAEQGKPAPCMAHLSSRGTTKEERERLFLKSIQTAKEKELDLRPYWEQELDRYFMLNNRERKVR